MKYIAELVPGVNKDNLFKHWVYSYDDKKYTAWDASHVACFITLKDAEEYCEWKNGQT